MKYEPQFIMVGETRFVMITEGEYQGLIDAREDADDLAAASAAMIDIQKEGAIPAVVSRAIRSGVHPIAAWRAHRNLSQAELARRIDVTQAAIGRLEKAPVGAGRAGTRRAIATALDAPLWSIGNT